MVAWTKDKDTLLLTLLLVAAAGLWYWIFAVPAGNFWVKLAISASVLAAGSLYSSWSQIPELFRFRLIDVPVGIASAALMYGIFLVGKLILTAVIPSTEAGIQSVYAPKSALASVALGTFLLTATGVVEEVFWRGFVQRVFARKLGPVVGILLGVFFYSVVHAWTLNLALILAAATAGAVWAVQFHFMKRLPSVIISHALWSTTIFLFLPVA